MSEAVARAPAGRMGRSARERRTGWHREASIKRGETASSWVPTEWELLLRKLQLDDAGAEAALRERSVRGVEVRQWVMQNWRNRYVPETVVELLGLTRQLEALDCGLGVFQMHRRERRRRDGLGDTR